MVMVVVPYWRVHDLSELALLAILGVILAAVVVPISTIALLKTGKVGLKAD